VLAARQQANRARRRLRQLAAGHPVLQRRQGGGCADGVSCGPARVTRDFDSAGPHRKAMGLNLAGGSSGTYQGRLRISKRAVHGRGNGSILRSCGWCSSAASSLVRGQEGPP
jgi:hypothetical protein